MEYATGIRFLLTKQAYIVLARTWLLPSLCLSIFSWLFMPAIWTAVVDVARHGGLNDRFIFVLATGSTHLLVALICHGVYLLCDQQLLLQHIKIPRKPIQVPSNQLVMKAIKKTAFELLFLQWVVLYFFYDLCNYFGMSVDFSPRDTAFIPLFAEFFLNTVWLDASFYAIHRLLHVPILYNFIHKQHHEFKGTMSVASEYAMVLEDIFSASLPTILPILLRGKNIGMHWIPWLGYRLFQTYETHSGYVFSLLHGPTTLYHDYHHTVNIGNFGGSPFFDCLFDTCGSWNNAISSGNYKDGF